VAGCDDDAVARPDDVTLGVLHGRVANPVDGRFFVLRKIVF